MHVLSLNGILPHAVIPFQEEEKFRGVSYEYYV